MRILQIVPSFSPVYGGPSQMVKGLSQALAAEGIEVTIITTNTNGDNGQAPLDVPLGKSIWQDGYEIIYFPCSPFRRYKFSLDLLRWLASHTQDYHLAHIHALFSPVTTAAATIARWNKLPYILRPLGTLDPADLHKKKQLKQIYGLLWEKPNLAGAAAIHFTSEEEAKVSARFGTTTKDLVIPLGVDLPANLPALGITRKQLGIDSNTKLILFMSRIDRKKGLDLLLPALESLQAEDLDFHFVLAGGNPQEPDYQAQIKTKIANSPLKERTTITGFVQGDLKLGLLIDADLFVLPSYYENFGIAVAEAMAVGTPVVISNGVQIWQDIETMTAGWVTACEVTQLTNSLREAIESDTERKQRGENARQLAKQKYSWSAIAVEMIQVYQSLMRSSA
ncbi:glycosyl transferase group 1 [Stanieria cyanosphaera PCC 7437]|uniref:Glycosyl transferase group 1 n=1 Tax=Stanieria cyanosphaera (strain ATCC 29371 / PCC 7437) TaxID=111780 RepID=K9XUE0_STAC7|nr:hormogonium polysaccharide biosynthesis glycosyltransferase HpsP [Stanieria cyanosphaera]AFZ35696.1 glycosyl transferase group 1 [Stanieria cyanosphaera PCC 7437]